MTFLLLFSTFAHKHVYFFFIMSFACALKNVKTISYHGVARRRDIKPQTPDKKCALTMLPKGFPLDPVIAHRQLKDN